MSVAPKHRNADAVALTGNRATVVLAVAAPTLLLVLTSVVLANWAALDHGRALLLLAHLACLIVGFGAVLTVDYTAARDLLLHRSFGHAVRLAGRLDIPIWLGYAGLVGTGVLLHPTYTDGGTQLKLAMVAAVGLNGAYVIRLRRQLAACGETPPALLVIRGGLAATVSQCAWWGAALIGFLHNQR